MISKNQIKKIASLGQKKQREIHGLFVVEGAKSVLEVAAVLKPHFAYATPIWIKEHPNLSFHVEEATEIELRKMSQLKNPQGIVAAFSIQNNSDSHLHVNHGLMLALDDVRDPGNMGTIIRLADWFGIETIYCSKGCADIYNPKVVQATMGSIVRVKVLYVDLVDFLLKTTLPVYGTFMDGKDIYREELPAEAIVVMGNEGQGISEEIELLLQHKLCIPSFSKHESGAESLNVSMAAAIVCSEFCRRM